MSAILGLLASSVAGSACDADSAPFVAITASHPHTSWLTTHLQVEVSQMGGCREGAATLSLHQRREDSTDGAEPLVVVAIDERDTNDEPFRIALPTAALDLRGSTWPAAPEIYAQLHCADGSSGSSAAISLPAFIPARAALAREARWPSYRVWPQEDGFVFCDAERLVRTDRDGRVLARSSALACESAIIERVGTHLVVANPPELVVLAAADLHEHWRVPNGTFWLGEVFREVISADTTALVVEQLALADGRVVDEVTTALDGTSARLIAPPTTRADGTRVLLTASNDPTGGEPGYVVHVLASDAEATQLRLGPASGDVAPNTTALAPSSRTMASGTFVPGGEAVVLHRPQRGIVQGWSLTTRRPVWERPMQDDEPPRWSVHGDSLLVHVGTELLRVGGDGRIASEHVEVHELLAASSSGGIFVCDIDYRLALLDHDLERVWSLPFCDLGVGFAPSGTPYAVAANSFLLELFDAESYRELLQPQP